MRFMMLCKSPEDFRAGPPPRALMEAMASSARRPRRPACMVERGGLLPSAKAPACGLPAAR